MVSYVPLAGHVDPGVLPQPNHTKETTLSERQRLAINALLDSADPDLSISRYAKLAQCSLDTALHDIKALVEAGILTPGSAGGCSTKYHLKPTPRE